MQTEIKNDTPVLYNVTSEYFQKAEPGKGVIIYGEGYNIRRHIEEIAAAHFILDTFGGTIMLLTESTQEGVKTPDFLWNERAWELKTPHSIKKVDDAVRYAARQIRSDPGGIILNFKGITFDMDLLAHIVYSRARRSALSSFDMIVLSNDQVKMIWRYKK